MNPVPTRPPAVRRATKNTESQTRNDLLDAARDCVATHGLEKVTSRLIATTANANLGAITYYFGSKDALVGEALFDDLFSRLSPVLENLESDGPATNRLLDGCQQLIAEFESSPHDVPVYLNALLASTRPGPLADRAQSLLVDLRTRLGGVIAELQRQDLIADWVDPAPMASLLISAANGIALQTQLDPDGPEVSQLASQLAGLLLAASK